jgi:hypothetical protein
MLPFLMSDMVVKDLDGVPYESSPYGWDNCVRKDTRDALINPDNLAYLGSMSIFARIPRRNEQLGSSESLAVGGFTLQRRRVGIVDTEEGAGIESDARAGYIHYYPDITTPDNPTGPNPK